MASTCSSEAKGDRQMMIDDGGCAGDDDYDEYSDHD